MTDQERVSVAEAIRSAAEQLTELLGRAPESVSSVKPTEQGWEARAGRPGPPLTQRSGGLSASHAPRTARPSPPAPPARPAPTERR
ncbi:gas vesicle protein GvpO [Streptomyces sp. NPDC006997]|uniref:gas vesicle protein GvpO n=1 Tax=Streptomyces sp. NPDC006997 TaxID=3155356 RepID=UPI0033DD5436